MLAAAVFCVSMVVRSVPRGIMYLCDRRCCFEGQTHRCRPRRWADRADRVLWQRRRLRIQGLRDRFAGEALRRCWSSLGLGTSSMSRRLGTLLRQRRGRRWHRRWHRRRGSARLVKRPRLTLFVFGIFRRGYGVRVMR